MRFDDRGFSLVELLLTVSLISVLFAFLMPVYYETKKLSLRSKCQSNLRQIACAFDSYLADYEGYYPNTNNQYLWGGYYWREPLRKYVVASGSEDKNKILSCPADPTPPGVYAGTSYAYSACFYMTPEQVNRIANPNYIRVKFASTNPKLPCSSIPSSMVKHPSKKVLAAEYWTLHAADNNVGWYDDPAETGNDPWSGFRNYLFADGRVRYLPTKEILPAESPLVERPRLLPDINLTRNGVQGKDVN
ncbi:MAG: type II secretion system protein [Armatimonadota bacterium]|nr:type II secretion system protein [Armatimonadota bacterium]